MAKITVIIKGIAIGYRKDEAWKFLFPFDSRCHTVKFSAPESAGGGAISLAQPNRSVNLTALDPAPASASDGTGLNEFINLTAPYSHENGIRTTANWAERAVLLTVEDAKFSLYERTKSRYQLLEGDVIKRAASIIGYSGIAEIECESMTLEVSGTGGFSREFKRDATLVFDNTCGRVTDDDDGDFRMLYWVVEDKLNPARQFTIERDPRDMPKGGGQLTENLPAQNTTTAKDAPDDGATVNDNPAPGERGLPCHIVIVTETGGLP